MELQKIGIAPDKFSKSVDHSKVLSGQRKPACCMTRTSLIAIIVNPTMQLSKVTLLSGCTIATQCQQVNVIHLHGL